MKLDDNYSFLIVGTIRDGGKYLKSSITQLYDIFSSIGKTKIFIVESDSNDATREILREYTSKNSFLNFVSFENLDTKFPDRIERLIFCRNTYVDMIRELNADSNFKYIVVADLDGINKKLSRESVCKALSSDFPWDVLTANQKYYYDILSLRHRIWCPNNYLEDYEWFRIYFSPYQSMKLALYDKMIKIPKTHDPIEVESAFGGLAIYQSWVFQKFDYSRNIGFKSDNEHTLLNKKIKLYGGVIYIHPALYNSGYNEHNWPKNFFLRILHYLLTYSNLSSFYSRYTYNNALINPMIPKSLKRRLNDRFTS